ncbi:MAG: sporulation transcription factor Spo0A [Clostridia bacterium]|nr:sporulation transcription factor Spo0A [Clostridia bacterium]
MENGKIRIVCADDNISVRRIFRNIINEEADMELVGEAMNGADLITIIKDKKPQVVILDIIMPKIDGIEVIKKIKADESIKNKPVFIAVSAIGDDRITKEAFDAGAEYYIMKPVDRDILIERIHWALKQDNERKKKEELKRRNTYTDIEIKVVDILLKLGMPVHIIGQRFMREALIMTMNDRECVSSITKLLYPDIARKNKTTATRVERAMRHAIEVVWTKGDKEWLEEIFRRPAGDISTRPTNSEFIARMAEYISIKLSIADKNGLTVDSIEELRHSS